MHLLAALFSLLLALPPRPTRPLQPLNWPNIAANVLATDKDFDPKHPKGGSACAISSTEALTAAHITDDIPTYMLTDVFGQHALANAITIDKKRDLAILKVGGDFFKVWAPLATEPPAIGDEVVMVGNLEGAVDKQNRMPFIGRIMGMLNGILLIDGIVYHGTSGSCVLNKKGEIVGIANILWQPENGRALAGAVPLW